MKITGRQCRQARALLKWNLKDLATRTSVNHMRVNNFERGILQLQRFEHDTIVETFEKNSIVFTDDFEVLLKKGERIEGPAYVPNEAQHGSQIIHVEEMLLESPTYTPPPPPAPPVTAPTPPEPQPERREPQPPKRKEE